MGKVWKSSYHTMLFKPDIKPKKISNKENSVQFVKMGDKRCVLKCYNYLDKGQRRRFRREIKVLLKLNHPNVASILSVFQQNDYYKSKTNGNFHILVLPRYENGDVMQWIKEYKPSVHKVRVVMQDALRGINALHGKGFIHRD